MARRVIHIRQAPSGSAMRGLHVRRKVLPSRTIAAEPRGDARATTGLCAFGVRRTKVLREKVHCRSLSSIHMDYNQPLVGGPSVHPTPATQIANLSLDGGSNVFRIAHFRYRLPPLGPTLATAEGNPTPSASASV